MEQEHQNAVQTMAAERYLLGEMADAERDAFENHYFDCRVCAEDVSTAAAFVENLRAVAVEDQDKKVVPFQRRHPVSEWISWAVAASLAMVMAGQQFVSRVPAPPIPAITAEAPVAKPLTFRGAERAGRTAFALSTKESATLYPEDEAGNDLAGYEWQIFNSDGKLVLTTPRLTVDKANEGYGVPLRPLPAGRYNVVLVGVRKDGNRATITQSTLLVNGE